MMILVILIVSALIALAVAVAVATSIDSDKPSIIRSKKSEMLWDPVEAHVTTARYSKAPVFHVTIKDRKYQIETTASSGISSDAAINLAVTDLRSAVDRKDKLVKMEEAAALINGKADVNVEGEAVVNGAVKVEVTPVEGSRMSATPIDLPPRPRRAKRKL